MENPSGGRGWSRRGSTHRAPARFAGSHRRRDDRRCACGRQLAHGRGCLRTDQPWPGRWTMPRAPAGRTNRADRRHRRRRSPCHRCRSVADAGGRDGRRSCSAPMRSYRVRRKSAASTSEPARRQPIWRAVRWRASRRRRGAVRRAAGDLRSGGARLASGGAGRARRARRHRRLACGRLARGAARTTAGIACACRRRRGRETLACRPRQADSAGSGVTSRQMGRRRQSARAAAPLAPWRPGSARSRSPAHRRARPPVAWSANVPTLLQVLYDGFVVRRREVDAEHGSVRVRRISVFARAGDAISVFLSGDHPDRAAAAKRRSSARRLIPYLGMKIGEGDIRYPTTGWPAASFCCASGSGSRLTGPANRAGDAHRGGSPALTKSRRGSWPRSPQAGRACALTTAPDVVGIE